MALAATPSTSLRLVHSSAAHADRKLKRITLALLLAAGLNCLVQIVWFWRFTSQNINYDAISYIGIARHLVRGDFSGSLNGYWSPMISWLIAASSSLFGNFTLAGRLISIASFILCLPLLYRLTLSLWRSPAIAAAAVLWFTLARGMVAFSVYFIGADFLLTAFVLAYFTVLLRCLRDPSPKAWLALGALHGFAFLAKAIAFPWLMISTLLACLLAPRRNFRVVVLRAVAALAIPLMIWCGWGLALRTKYGVFTAGYQSRWNLLDDRTRDSVEAGPLHLSVLHDTSQNFGADMVVDNMPPGSPPWHAKPRPSETLRLLLQRDRDNLPQALKELMILITPGGILAVLLAIAAAKRTSRNRQPEAWFLWIVLVSAASLMAAYCMLVFDERYLYPIVPLLIAVAVPFVAPLRSGGNQSANFYRLRAVALALLVVSTLFLFLYHASPFRSLRRDFQLSCYDAGRKLHAGECRKLAVIGAGPYPEHGVGWEAGIYSSYFAGCRMIAYSPELPEASKTTSIESDLRAVNPDAVLLLGTAGSTNFEAGILAVRNALSDLDTEPVNDPDAGAVGVLLRSKPAPAVGDASAVALNRPFVR
jgi:4-amino-4-deoxy-L-arabinose transferase-like glycosyltransferase